MSVLKSPRGKNSSEEKPAKERANASDGITAEIDQPDDPVEHKEKPDPTRYGDWEKNGRCIDF